jgi:uncharacterized protein (DUF488 family)
LIYTIGHGTRSIECFIGLLKQHGIKSLADVRTIPASRHNPQFGQVPLKESLRRAGINYTHIKELGGLRHALKDSINTAWHNASFRGFADYMQTEGFSEGLARLLNLASAKQTAIMCAESVPWRCHRSLIADALTVRGVQVEHIISETNVYAHKITPWAKVNGLQITYP